MRLGLFKAIAILSLWLQFGHVYPQQREPEVTVPPEILKGRYIPEFFGGHRGKYIRDDSGKYQHKDMPYDGGYGDRGPKYAHDAPNALLYQMQAQPELREASQPPLPPLLPLGPKDQLRFMVDFNYNSTGWQIIQFDWIRDGNLERKYNFVNKNQLWAEADNADTYGASEVNLDQGQDDAGGYTDYAMNDDVDISEERRSSEEMRIDDDSEYTTTHSDGPTEQQHHHGATEPIHFVHLDGEYKEEKFNVTYTHQNKQIVKVPSDIRNAIGEILKYIEKDILPTLD